MSLTVRCPACDNGFVVDASCAGEELACPSCFAAVPVPVPVPAAPTPKAARSVPVSKPKAAAVATVASSPAQASAGVAVAAAPVAPAAPAEKVEVVCPRCQLHFTPKDDRPASRQGRKTILIVEDQSFFKQLAKDALADKYEVKFATSNVEAKAALAQGGISLMVLDLTLENGDQGIDLLRGMSLKPCPILIYTSRDESEMYGEEWEELKQLGADDVVMKNMKVDESLLTKVAAALGDLPEEDANMD